MPPYQPFVIVELISTTYVITMLKASSYPKMPKLQRTLLKKTTHVEDQAAYVLQHTDTYLDRKLRGR